MPRCEYGEYETWLPANRGGRVLFEKEQDEGEATLEEIDSLYQQVVDSIAAWRKMGKNAPTSVFYGPLLRLQRRVTPELGVRMVERIRELEKELTAARWDMKREILEKFEAIDRYDIGRAHVYVEDSGQLLMEEEVRKMLEAL